MLDTFSGIITGANLVTHTIDENRHTTRWETNPCSRFKTTQSSQTKKFRICLFLLTKHSEAIERCSGGARLKVSGGMHCNAQAERKIWKHIIKNSRLTRMVTRDLERCTKAEDIARTSSIRVLLAICGQIAGSYSKPIQGSSGQRVKLGLEFLKLQGGRLRSFARNTLTRCANLSREAGDFRYDNTGIRNISVNSGGEINCQAKSGILQ